MASAIPTAKTPIRQNLKPLAKALQGKTGVHEILDDKVLNPMGRAAIPPAIGRLLRTGSQ